MVILVPSTLVYHVEASSCLNWAESLKDRHTINAEDLPEPRLRLIKDRYAIRPSPCPKCMGDVA